MSWSCEWGFLWGSDCIGNPQFTSASWTYEAFYKFPKDTAFPTSQSLVRLQVTGSASPSDTGAAVLNVVAISGSDRIELWTRPTYATGTADQGALNLFLTGVDIFDGNKWNVSVGRFRNDDPSDYLPDPLVKSDSSSSYFLRAARAQNGIIQEEFLTQSFYLDDRTNTNTNKVFQSFGTSTNISGTYIAIGSQSLPPAVFFLHTASLPDIARTTDFDGKVAQMRFWSKGLLEREWREHVRNFKSLGVANPLLNFNFVTELAGSFERLRIDASTDQITTASNASGEIEIFDFSQNELHFTGSGFEISTEVIKPETFNYGYISSKFDQASTTNKVRARGFQDFDIARERGAKFGIANQIALNEEPQDDTRFTIDFSIIDSLDQDIINIFATLEKLDNLLGDPELQFSPDYPGLENLREIYFNRLTEKINLKSFFEFFKWFDRSIGDFIAALLPRKTRFRGVNFVIESHMLERPKFENLNVDQYLNAATERNSLKGTILLQQIVGDIKKY